MRGQITDLEKKRRWCSSWEAETRGTLKISNQPSLCTKFQPARAVEGDPVSQRRKRTVFFVSQSKAFLEELFAIVQKGVT